MSDSPDQSNMFATTEQDDGVVIIGTPRDARIVQSHSTFRKIEMGAKRSKLLSLEWGEIMVMLPRQLYERVEEYIARPDQASKADALIALLESGLACSE